MKSSENDQKKNVMEGAEYAQRRLETYEYFSRNLEALIKRANISKKDFAEMIGIAQPTLSGYLKGKPPQCDFLIALKVKYPYLKIDDLLFTDMEEFFAESVNELHPYTDMSKYYGTYYLYYIDTSNRSLATEAEKTGYPSLSLKYAVVRISEDRNAETASQAVCTGIFGIGDRDTAKKIHMSLEQCTDANQADIILQQESRDHIYAGTLNTSNQHIFISLSRIKSDTDMVLMIMNKPRINGEKLFVGGLGTMNFVGGLGTMNSISSGRVSEPIVQLAALSRDYAYLSDEQIKSQLWFAPPQIHVNNEFAAREIIRLTKTLYNADISSSNENEAASGNVFTEKNIETLLTSYLGYLVDNNIKNNRLWYGRVSERNDDDWFHLLSDADKFHREGRRK